MCHAIRIKGKLCSYFSWSNAKMHGSFQQTKNNLYNHKLRKSQQTSIHIKTVIKIEIITQFMDN